MVERNTADTQERVAMLRHRLEAIPYLADLLERGEAAYAFSTESGNEFVIMLEVGSLERMDWLIKRSPHFAYVRSELIPVVSTEALVREAQDYLGEHIIADDDLPKLNGVRRDIDPYGDYWLAWKEVPPFSPLLSIQDQDDVHRRTVLSQEAHLSQIEFADDNPVGRPIGIMIAEGDRAEIEQHVQSCEVYPDTIVTYTRMLSLTQAKEKTIVALKALRPSFTV